MDGIQLVCESGCCLRLDSLEAESEMRILAWAIYGASALRREGEGERQNGTQKKTSSDVFWSSASASSRGGASEPELYLRTWFLLGQEGAGWGQ